jgi:hypothetical protein
MVPHVDLRGVWTRRAMPKRPGDLVRKAADAVRPIFDGAVQELGLGSDEAEALMLRMTEA